MGGMEAIGDAVTGGLLGRAVEPEAGKPRGRPHARGELPQLRRAARRRLLPRLRPARARPSHARAPSSTISLHGVLHFEGKIWRTLPLLAWRPGELTRRYIDGERARFVSPIALFLFSVFLMFAVFELDRALGSQPAISGTAASRAADREQRSPGW